MIPTATATPSVSPTAAPTLLAPTLLADHPTMAPTPSIPSPTSVALTAIQNEGLACMAMAASIPGLQTLTGGCIREKYNGDDDGVSRVSCLSKCDCMSISDLCVCVPVDDMHRTVCEPIV